MFVPRLISSAVARLHEGRYGVYSRCKMLFTAYHGSAAPTGPWRGTIAIFGEQMIWIYLEILAANLLITFVFGDHRLLVLYVNWAPATGPLAGRQRRGPAAGCRPGEPRGSSPPTWRGGAR